MDSEQPIKNDDLEQTTAACSEEAPLPQEVRREVMDFVKIIAWFLIMFFAVKTYVVEVYEVQGRSMLPTLHDRERIIVFKLPHVLSTFAPLRGLNAIREGDIVVFESPVENNKRYVKRVVAKGPKSNSSANTVDAKTDAPPQSAVSVLYDQGAVYVNNRRINEDYLGPNRDEDEYSAPVMRVLPGDYYVLGDNRNESKDSRSFGPIHQDRVIGEAVLCFWPPSKIRLLR